MIARTVGYIILFTSLTFAVTGFAEELVIDQMDKNFVKDGKTIKKVKAKLGDVVLFKNKDPWAHNIFSQSKIMAFNLGVFRKGDSRSITLAKTGRLEVECAIHPGMKLKIDVNQ